MQFNVRGWNNIPIATVIIKFIDGRIVEFLHRCISACRFDQIVPNHYKRHITFKPLLSSLIQAIACLSPRTTSGDIPSRPSSSVLFSYLKLKYVPFDPPRQLRRRSASNIRRTANMEICPHSPGHGDCGHLLNLTSSHGPAALGRRNRQRGIVTEPPVPHSTLSGNPSGLRTV